MYSIYSECQYKIFATWKFLNSSDNGTNLKSYLILGEQRANEQISKPEPTCSFEISSLIIYFLNEYKAFNKEPLHKKT